MNAQCLNSVSIETTAISSVTNDFALLFCSGRQVTFKRVVENEVVTLGRNGRQQTKNRFACNHPSVSREHAQIVVLADRLYVLVDRNSKFGTVVNNRRLAPGENYSLKNGDKIWLGLAEPIVFRCAYQFDFLAASFRPMNVVKTIKTLWCSND